MNIKKIKELVELMNENGLSEIEIEEEGLKVKLSKRGSGYVEQMTYPMTSQQMPQGMPPSQQQGAGQGTSEADAESKLKAINTPMVGTFYRSASPEDDAYVEVGDTVKKGDVICIIEAMKLMNEIKAEFDCKISKIAVQNAEAVEYGQTLFLVEPI